MTEFRRVADSLQTLLHQLDAAAPHRSKISDGALGDKAHAARTSDHNPDAAGVVRARDFTDDAAGGLDARVLREALRLSRDPRISYVISEGEIFSSRGRRAWTWRPYHGPNGHFHHVHVSVRPGADGDADGDWAIATKAARALHHPKDPDQDQDDQEDDMTPEQAETLEEIRNSLRVIEQWITTDALDDVTHQPKGIAKRLAIVQDWITKPGTGIGARVQAILERPDRPAVVPAQPAPVEPVG